MNADYVRVAHRRAVWMELQRILLEYVSSGDDPALKKILCEEVFFSDREVRPEAILEAMATLQLLEQDEKTLMSQFEFRRKDVSSAKQPAPTSDPPAAAEGGRTGE